MKITINGETREVAATTVAAVLAEIGMGEAKVATALNEEFVPATLRNARTVNDGDRLEIVTPRQGG